MKKDLIELYAKKENISFKQAKEEVLEHLKHLKKKLDIYKTLKQKKKCLFNHNLQ